MNDVTLTAFVISDIHAFDAGASGGTRPSHFDITRPAGAGADDPIAGLKALCEKQKITADYLIVCGDIADRAQPTALTRSWQEVHELKKCLKAERIVATVGNHDVDSRHTHNDHDAKGVLLDLLPGFPFERDAENNHFWTHHFCCFRDKRTSTRFVVLNSSGYHGEFDPKKIAAEYEHGRVSERTLRRLKHALEAEGRANANILICHHHPQKHDEFYLGDYDDMRGGSALLRTLDSAAFGPWLVFHGHKHHPKISYATGGTDAPVIFSAGSCAAILQPELQHHARNQVYRVDLKIGDDLTSTCLGEFQAWDWGPGLGWIPARPGSGLPAHGGFGYRGDLGAIVKEIQNSVSTEMHWKTVKQSIPALRNILPSDLAKLCAILRTQCGFTIEDGANGEPLLIQK